MSFDTEKSFSNLAWTSGVTLMNLLLVIIVGLGFFLYICGVKINSRCKGKQEISNMQEKRQEKSQIKRNISIYLQEKGVSDYEFYKKSGITRGVLSQPNGISEDNISRFLAYAPDVNIDWLLTGEGSMLRSEEEVHKVSAAEKKKEEIGKDVKGIPLIPLSAMAGAMTSERTVLEYECERYVVPAFSGADFLIPVKGDSMMPTYQSGDLIACKRVPLGDLFFQWNMAYVLDTKQGPLVKRIKPGSDDMHVMIVSDNKTYDPFELPRSAINSVAMVMGIIRLE